MAFAAHARRHHVGRIGQDRRMTDEAHDAYAPDETLRRAEATSYSAMWSAFRERYEVSGDDRDALLAAVCSMMLREGGDGERFVPMVVFADGTSSASENNLSDDAIDVLEHILPIIETTKLRARIADLVWPRRNGAARLELALTAIDAYRDCLLENDKWSSGSTAIARRSIEVAKRFGEPTRPRLLEVRRVLLDHALGRTLEDKFQIVRIAEILRTAGLGSADDCLPLLESIERLSRQAEQVKEFRLARTMALEAAEWSRFADNGDERRQSQISRTADLWVAEAESRLSGEGGSNLVAASFFESALQELRRIPKKWRAAMDVQARIASVTRRMQECNSASLDEMVTFASDPIDLTDAIAQARSRVTGRDALGALFALATGKDFSDPEKVRSFATELVEASPLMSLFPNVQITRDGRVAAKSGENEALWREMVRHEQTAANLFVRGFVLPALETTRAEHYITVADFVEIAQQSPIVPPARAILVGTALAFGFNFEFSTALYLLTPQMENFVRYHLKSAGVQTTHTDGEGIETENSLNTLLLLPEAEQLFGAGLVFELRVVFTGPFGGNLRNDTAHGLLSDSESNSYAAIYAWWLALRLLYVPFWNRLREESTPTPDEAGSSPDG